MDDPYLDSRSSRRVWEEMPRGPFEVNEPLPKPVQLRKSSTNKVTNKPQELLHFKWQRNAAQRVLEPLEALELSRQENVLTSLTVET